MLNRNVKYTYRDYLNLPESEEKRYELIAGELRVVPSPTTAHQRIVKELAMQLHRHVESYDLGEVLWAPLDVVLSETDVVQPASEDHRGAQGRPGRIRDCPGLRRRDERHFACSRSAGGRRIDRLHTSLVLFPSSVRRPLAGP